MLRGEQTHGAIRAFIVDSGEVPPERHQLSRHSLKCLGLQPRSEGNPRSAESPDIEDEPLPPLKDIGELALKVFYRRLKKSPEDVSSRDLIPLVKLYLEDISKEGGNDEMDERLAQLLSAD